MGTKILIAVLLVLVAWAGWFGVAGWSLESDVTMSGHGYVAMALGIIFTLVVGIGLMALMFYSSRKGYDEAASRPQKQDSTRPPGATNQKRYHHYKS